MPSYYDDAGNPVDENGNPLGSRAGATSLYFDDAGNPVDSNGLPLEQAKPSPQQQLNQFLAKGLKVKTSKAGAQYVTDPKTGEVWSAPETVVKGQRKFRSADDLAGSIAGRQEPDAYSTFAKAMSPRQYADIEAGREPGVWNGVKDGASMLQRAIVGGAEGLGSFAGAKTGGMGWGDALREGRDQALATMSAPGGTEDQGAVTGTMAGIAKDPYQIPLAAAMGRANLLPAGARLGGQALSRAGVLGLGRLGAAIEGMAGRAFIAPTAQVVAGSTVPLAGGAIDRASDWDSSTQAMPSATEMALTVGANAIPTGGGAILKQMGINKFPGLAKGLLNRAVPEHTKALVRENLDRILGADIFPKGKEAFLALAEKNRARLGGLYDAATEAVPNSWATSASDLEQSFRDKFRALLGERDALAINPANQYEAVLPQRADELISEAMGRVKGGQNFRGQDPDWLRAKELARVKTSITNKETWRNGQTDNLQLLADLGTAFHEASNDALMSAPNYAATLGAETPREYALWKGLQAVVNRPGNIGLTSRFPWGQTAPAWNMASMLYKTGQIGAGLGGLMPYIGEGVRQQNSQ